MPTPGPQLFAYAVRTDELFALRDACRAILEDADIHPLIGFFEARVGRHTEHARRATWSASTEVLDRLVDDLGWWEQRLSDYHREEIRDRGGDLPGTLRTRAAELTRRDRIRCHPLRWWALACDAYEVRRYRTLDSESLVQYTLVSLTQALNELEQSPHALEIIPPCGTLSWVRHCRFFGEDGKEVPNSDVERAKPSYVFRSHDGRAAPGDWSDDGPPSYGREWISPDHAVEEIHEQLAVESLHELLVEPYAASIGPGPFFGIPEAARPLEEDTWTRLPLFRAAQFHTQLASSRYLAGEQDLRAAIEEFEGGRPGDDWWEPLTREILRETYGDDGPWKGFDQVLEYWPQCRERFLSAMRSALRSGEALLLRVFHTDDQGPITPPWTPEYGALSAR